MADESAELAERLARLKQLQDELNAALTAGEPEKTKRDETKGATQEAVAPPPNRKTSRS